MMAKADRAAALVLAMIGLLPAASSAEASARRQKPVVLPASGTTTLVAVRLDADVHAVATDGYGDLRILDRAGTETPFMVVVSHTVLLEDHPGCRFRVLAEPGTTYRLAYGGDLAAPRYDTAAIRVAADAGVAAMPAALGPESVGAMPAARPSPVRLLADGRFQFGVILVLVVILAATLFRAARRIDAAPPSPE